MASGDSAVNADNEDSSLGAVVGASSAVPANESHAERAPMAVQKRMKDPTPEMEWWDVPLVERDPSAGLESDFPYIINVQKVTHYVEHPVPIEPILEPDKAAVTTMILTPKERTKLRRRKRQEAEREKQDKIRMGLVPPPPPKVKLSNLMRALGDVAASDPSKIERRVRQQMEQRMKQHEARNEARKLDPEERSKKTALKWQQVDVAANGIGMCAFAIRDLSDKRHLFKVDRNAAQVHLTGACVICPNIANLIIVEGSNKSLKMYKRLLLHRIQWSNEEADIPEPEEDSDEEDEDDDDDKPKKISEDQQNVCLLWEGTVRDRNFKQWKVYTTKSETEARKLMADRNSAHYWDMARKHQWPAKSLSVFPMA